jgi:hypothetical protein
MEPKDNFENIKLPYIKNVKSNLLRNEVESINDEEMLRRLTCMRRKLDDDVFRYHVGWENKKIHGTTNTTVHNG